MTQPSISQYFNCRKRVAADDYKVDRPRKILILDSTAEKNIILKKNDVNSQIQEPKQETIQVKENKTSSQIKDKKQTSNEFNDIKKKICRSSKLDKLKKSLNNFNKLAEKLEAAEKKTKDLSDVSPKLSSFKSIEFEVLVSPSKTQSPEKPYLSPKKEPSVRRNLLGALSSPKKLPALTFDSHPKDSLTSSVKQGLKLPFKFRILSEMFRAIDTVSQILYNRKEVITLQKVKPAVEKIMKRTLTEKYLSQIKYIYPDAFHYRQEKLKKFGSGMRQEEWHLVLSPNIGDTEKMTSETLIDRRRKLHELLVNVVKTYHNEFLLSLDPPMVIEKDQITRWHPEFDIEKIPDIEQSSIPQPPVEDKLTTGKEVLERARQIFNCNTRMDLALAKLKAAREAAPESGPESSAQDTTILKGISKALLEKVRQKQAAKALMSMTRSADKDSEVQLYSRLPEIARLARNLFVSEKKQVLPLDTVVDKLINSYRCFLKKNEIEEHLRVISKELPKWLEFYEKRASVFVKLNKNADLNVVITTLSKLAKEKSDS